MEKRQILWAIVFGSMLAITGCGDDESSNGGTAGSGGSAGSSGGAGSGGSGGGNGAGICDALCAACGDVGSATCQDACQDDGSLDGCPTELAALTGCLEDNGCGIGFAQCTQEWADWGLCLNGL